MVRGADRHPALGEMRSKLPRFARKTYPLSAVGDAVLAGIERRSRAVVVPRWIRRAVGLSSAVQRLTEREALRAAPDLDAAFERDVVERGAEASKPVGAGGAASG